MGFCLFIEMKKKMLKYLTYEQLLEAPHLIQWIYFSAINDRPVGGSMVEEAREKHPEYFVDKNEEDYKWFDKESYLKEKEADGEMSRKLGSMIDDAWFPSRIIFWAVLSAVVFIGIVLWIIL